jgi:hypothetical protein
MPKQLLSGDPDDATVTNEVVNQEPVKPIPKWTDIRESYLGEFSKKLKTRGPLNEAQKRIRLAVMARRERSHKWNRKYHEKVGMCLTLNALDRVKRLNSENLELDDNVDRMLGQIRELRDKFVAKLAKREKDIAAGAVDPNEPAAKTNAEQMRHWLEMVPSLLEHCEKRIRKENRITKPSDTTSVPNIPNLPAIRDVDSDDEDTGSSDDSSSDVESENSLDSTVMEAKADAVVGEENESRSSADDDLEQSPKEEASDEEEDVQLVEESVESSDTEDDN